MTELGRLIGKKGKYQHDDNISDGVNINALPFQINCVKLDGATIIETHRNFIPLSETNRNKESMSKPLARELNNQIHH